MKDWQKVEAVLFGSGKYLTEEQISQLSGVPKKSLKHALDELKKHYSHIDSSLDVFTENNSWKLNVKEDFAHIVKNVISEAEMSKPVMETLALIAYKTPVLQSEIIDSRGAGAYEYISLLEEKGFIVKEKFGRTFKIKVTTKFYDYFDISGDSKLRQMFKDVKKPEKMGSLEVYTETKPAENGNGDNSFSEKILERMKKVEYKPEDHEEKKKFLHDFDNKFSKTKTDIDATDKEMDEFRRVVPHVADGEGAQPENQQSHESHVQDIDSLDDAKDAKEDESSNDDADPDKVLKRFEEVLDKMETSKDDEKEVESEEAESQDEAEEEETEEAEESEASEVPGKNAPAKKSGAKDKKEAAKPEHKESKSKENKTSAKPKPKKKK